MRIATYNIRVADGGIHIDGVADELKVCGADIIGLQEIDLNVERSGKIDLLKLLAEKAGYPYYHFYPAIQLQGGFYGTGILSRHPILSVNMYKYECADFEKRVLGNITVEIKGRKINFFNTHLSYEDLNIRTSQFEVMKKTVYENTPFIITGDFNVTGFDEFAVFSDCNLANNSRSAFLTFKGDECNYNGFYSIDNIIASKVFMISSTKVLPSVNSDHEMLIADIEFK
jgi:endonuclease/exonuclease/phosphatase family metal-dependent hydrolase